MQCNETAPRMASEALALGAAGTCGRSARLTSEEVEACLHTEEGELSSVDLTFILARDAPDRWTVWQALVTELCEAGNLSLVDEEAGTKVGAPELLRLLSQAVAGKELAEHFGWPPAPLACE